MNTLKIKDIKNNIELLKSLGFEEKEVREWGGINIYLQYKIKQDRSPILKIDTKTGIIYYHMNSGYYMRALPEVLLDLFKLDLIDAVKEDED